MDKKQPVVAFLGPRASYTHQAAQSVFPPESHTLTPLMSIADCFAAVQNDKASYSVVPFENSSNGAVVFTLDLLADIQGLCGDVVVTGEIYLPVHHCLVGRVSGGEGGGTQAQSVSGSHDATGLLEKEPTESQQPHVRPTHDLSHIKKLYSHPQAWGQCKRFLSTHLKGIEQIDASSTSRAAELVAEDTTGTTAAISSKLAAEMSSLSVLADSIEDFEGNSTRFFILQRRDAVSPPPRQRSTPQTSQSDPQTQPPPEEASPAPAYKSLLSFTVSHTIPGALQRSLGAFNNHGINLTSINTRPSGEAAWHYIFLVEFEGRKGEGKVDEALKELEGAARGWRWLGSWEAWRGGREGWDSVFEQ
ncbi:prephenate dehydratase [Saxophila tyrrhenica]|uniref:prephenate dehydratase n=1 Tax=Saxophila tyrrhenica TaxID=1690608 RepID=A0AAV9P138_9PEZI|nr:prephenate dehydratase [Saxophila tyrrhenica]